MFQATLAAPLLASPTWVGDGLVVGRSSGRLASLGLLFVLVAVPGFALCAAMMTFKAGTAARHATEVSNVFDQARYAVGLEESLERKYRLEPGSGVRGLHGAASGSVVESLERAGVLGVDAAFLKSVLTPHEEYLAAIERMFSAIDAGDVARANAIDSGEVDPLFDRIQEQVLAAARESRGKAVHELGTLASIQTGVLVAMPVIFAVGAVLVVFFWHVLGGYRRSAAQALLREASSAQEGERRFRSLVQNASDVILICGRSGVITYQSPAAEAGWHFGDAALLGRPLLQLMHPDARPALLEVWEQLQDGPGTLCAGATRSIELQMLDGGGGWRDAQLLLTSLLHEPAVAGFVATIRDIRERKAFEHQLTQRAFYDSLTGLPNRLLLRDRLQQALVRGARRGTLVGLVFLDLDNFKLINDSLGHLVGDELLVEVAGRLQGCVRAEDTVARLGGDEFVIVLQDLAGEVDAVPVANAIVHQFSRTFTLDGRNLTVTVSMGVALSGANANEADVLLRNADVAMYRAKSDGRGRFLLFDASMHVDTLARLELENDLRRAIIEGELRVHYQPIVQIAPGSFGEFEALVRWQHPTRGLVAPADFIDVAEETGLIVPLGQWVLEEACRQMVAWHAEFRIEPPIVLSVNLSPRQFQSPNLVGDVARVLRESGLPPGCLKLEITEGVILRDAELTIATLWQLKNLGIKLAVDDFGMGYSSLSYLRRLPLDVLKIDRSFVSGLGQDQEDSAIVRAVISLAKSLDLAVTGEGIETAEQAAMLGALGCDRGQGYYYGKPLDGDATRRLLGQELAAKALLRA